MDIVCHQLTLNSDVSYPDEPDDSESKQESDAGKGKDDSLMSELKKVHQKIRSLEDKLKSVDGGAYKLLARQEGSVKRMVEQTIRERHLRKRP